MTSLNALNVNAFVKGHFSDYEQSGNLEATGPAISSAV
jgi:hypothetical protein